MRNFVVIAILVLTSFSHGVKAQKLQPITEEQALQLLAQYQKQPEVSFKNPKNIPSMVVYYTKWCGYCQQLAPNVDKIEKEYKNKIFIKRVDIETKEGKEFSASNKVNGKGIPHVQIYSADGRLIRNKLGYQSYESLKKEVDLFI